MKQMISQKVETIVLKMVQSGVFEELDKGYEFTDTFRAFAKKFNNENRMEIDRSENDLERWMLILENFNIKDISDRRNFAKILLVRKMIIDERRKKN